jgi:hypothetical protein
MMRVVLASFVSYFDANVAGAVAIVWCFLSKPATNGVSRRRPIVMFVPDFESSDGIFKIFITDPEYRVHTC